jgi:uncharacterized protein (DUF169 family)
MRHSKLAQDLQDLLELRYVPVALAFVTEPPDGVPRFSGTAPSACALWRQAEHSVFYADAGDHVNCPIGALTMGFSMSDEQSNVLMNLVGKMGEIGYIDPQEAANIPSVPGEKNGIVYGPLEQFPIEPDIVLLWCTPASTMLLDEAVGASRWTPEQGGIGTFGRPSCAAIPIALSRGLPTLSVGCQGMRVFTEIDADLELAVLPKATLSQLSEAVNDTVHANAQMNEYYQEQKSHFSS